MGIATSDGQYYEDEFEMHSQQVAPDETEPADVVEKHTAGFMKMLKDYGSRIDPKAWDAWINSMPLSENIEDRRDETPDISAMMELSPMEIQAALKDLVKNEPKLPAKKKK